MSTYTDRELRILAARCSVSSPRGHRVPLDLAGADLEMATIPHLDLTGADLKGANLRGAMLWGALLDGACLDDADLTCADLTWSSTCGSSMKGTLLVEADLDEALVDHLGDAVTAGAGNLMTTHICSGAFQRLGNAGSPHALENVLGRSRETDDDVLRVHLRTASLTLRKRGAAGWRLGDPESTMGAEAYLVYKARKLAQARSRVLDDADLRDLLRWSASSGKPLNLRGCTLCGADLRNASLRGACLAFTDATGADLRGVDLTGADLEGAGGWARAG